MTGFGSHGGEDHYVVTNSEEVAFLLGRDVGAQERELFAAELTAAAPYETSPAIRARIAVAMLYLADGDLEKLREARAVADTDWRDLFMMAEYPSAPPYGTEEESPDEKQARQQRDIAAMASWRQRKGPPQASR